jgi:hypothetical protein
LPACAPPPDRVPNPLPLPEPGRYDCVDCPAELPAIQAHRLRAHRLTSHAVGAAQIAQLLTCRSSYRADREEFPTLALGPRMSR